MTITSQFDTARAQGLRFIAALCMLAPSTIVMATTAHDDFLVTVEDRTLEVEVVSLVANDTVNGDVSFAVVESPQLGSLSCTSALCTYIPNAGATGIDAFTYRIEEISAFGTSSDAQVAVRIQPKILPLAGDWNGNGDTDLGWYNSETGDVFFLDLVYPNKNPLPPTVAAQRCARLAPLGAQPGWILFVGDWNQDLDDDLGLFDPTTATFHLFADVGGTWLSTTSFAHPGKGQDARPVAADWNGDGKDEVGLLQPTGDSFVLLDDNSPGAAITPHTLTGLGTAERWPLAITLPCGPSGVATTAVWEPGTNVWMLSDGNVDGPPIGPIPFSNAIAGQLLNTGAWSGGDFVSLYDPTPRPASAFGGFILDPYTLNGTCTNVIVSAPGGQVILLPPPEDPFTSVCSP